MSTRLTKDENKKNAEIAREFNVSSPFDACLAVIRFISRLQHNHRSTYGLMASSSMPRASSFRRRVAWMTFFKHSSLFVDLLSHDRAWRGHNCARLQTAEVSWQGMPSFSMCFKRQVDNSIVWPIRFPISRIRAFRSARPSIRSSIWPNAAWNFTAVASVSQRSCSTRITSNCR